MQSGFNSDITFRGITYHVQTEDWGAENPFIVSRIFKQGAVIKTFKTSYTDIFGQTAAVLRFESRWEKHLSFALKSQHEQVIEFLTSGKAL